MRWKTCHRRGFEIFEKKKCEHIKKIKLFSMNETMDSTPHHVYDSSTRIDSNFPQPRLYQVWKGRNIFIFGGRFVFGPDAGSLFLTLFLILAPLILFWGFVAKRIVNEFSCGEGIVIVVLSVILATYIILLLFLTSGRDPGIIPRNTHPPEPEDEGDTSSLSTDWTCSQIGAPIIPLTKNVKVNGIVVRVKYCQTCMLYRPPRCSHCSICNNCVERFDHHCPWVGQCIGKRNYRYFFMFVSSTTILCSYIFTCCWINIKKLTDKANCNIWEAFEESPVSGILIVYTFIVSWFVGGLTAFHLYLISTNQTTYKNFRYRYERKRNPFNLGCANNFKEIFCSKVPNSRHKFRAKVTFDSSTRISISSHLSQTMSLEVQEKTYDIEMGKQLGHDTDVQLKDIERHQVMGVSGLLQRSGIGIEHGDLDHKGNCASTPDAHLFASKFEIEPCVKERDTRTMKNP